MPEEAVPVPKVEEITFPAKLLGSLDNMKKVIADIPFYSAKLQGGALSIARVESRNIHKRPYLFYIVTMSEDQLKVVYSIPQDTSESMRRAFVIKNVASILSLVGSMYQVDESKFLQYVDSVIDNVLNGLSQSYSTLFNKYDALLSEYREIKRLNVELASANRNLTVQSTQLDKENKGLKDQLKQLQTYSDETLIAMIEDWIEVHNNTIDINEFAQNYKLTAPRVEQVLDKMVSMGYVELKG